MHDRQPDNNQTQTPLSSWKEIGAYLQRNAATARRWEKEEGLPIHRHSHKIRSSVYAYPSEIDAWRLSRKVVSEPVAEPVAAPVSTLWRVPTFALAILLCLIMVGNGVRPQTVSAKDGPLSKRLVCSDCGDPEGNLSQDGRSLVYTDWDSGDLAIRDMKTGKVKRLMAKPGEWGNGAFGEAPVFSQDTRQIAYDWYSGKSEGDRSQLRLIPNEAGAKARVLVDNPNYTFYQVDEWFPDGKSILVTISQPDQALLARISVADGAVTVLKPLGWRYRTARSTRRISPDGRYIAYSALAVNPTKFPLASTDPKDIHLYVLAADGSSETEIVKTAGINRNPRWTADGRHLLFTSDRTGKTGLWSIAMRDGKAVGEPSLVSPEIGDIDIFSLTGSSLTFYRKVENDFVHIAQVGPRGGREEQSFTGIGPVWSPDGKYVAFKRHHPGSPDRYDLVIHALETGEERTPLAGRGTTGGAAPGWYHNGGQIMTGIEGFDEWPGAHRIDLKSGEIRDLPPLGDGTLFPDDKTWYKVLPPDGKTPGRVVAFDLDTGKQRVALTSLPDSSSIAVSPDGRTLAVLWRSADSKRHVSLIPVDGGSLREVFTSDADGGRRVAWDRDGSSILFSQHTGRNSRLDVMRVSAEGGQATPVFTFPHDPQGFDLSPDGSRIAYSSNEGATELWALDNVLPALK